VFVGNEQLPASADTVAAVTTVAEFGSTFPPPVLRVVDVAVTFLPLIAAALCGPC